MQQTDTKKVSSKMAKLIVWLVVITTPYKYWYQIAYYISYCFGTFSRQSLLGNYSIGYQRAVRLNRLLSLFTRSGVPFYIPVKVNGLENLAPTTNGLAICSIHLPLIKVGIRGILDSGFGITAIIAAMVGEDGKMSFWGTTKRVRVIYSINANVLIQARGVLKDNGSVFLMLDSNLGKPFSPNMLRFCGMMGTKVVFLLAELSADSTIMVDIVTPPFPYCEDEEKIRINIKALEKHRDSILTRYKQRLFATPESKG